MLGDFLIKDGCRFTRSVMLFNKDQINNYGLITKIGWYVGKTSDAEFKLKFYMLNWENDPPLTDNNWSTYGK